MRSFLTGMLVGMLGGAAAACYCGNDKEVMTKIEKKTRQVMGQTFEPGCLLSKVGGQAGKIIRK